MTESASQLPAAPIQDYNHHDIPAATETLAGDVQQVITPSDPPEFGPAAARALLRLLLAVHRKRTSTADTSGEEP
jgi:hypothetical protein